ncbi:MAG TPA: ChuX/HutX family heme-like substrate-binding protein [Tepidisphaeraceae bacterium]|nr:ChuX/HutX family heme-like substrate-binding protein [Tepidisphaeraceae bacterium]
MLEVTADNLEKIREKIRENTSRMTVQIARELNVPEVDVIRAMPAENVVELDIARWEELIRSFEQLANVHVIASNGSVTLECFGQFGNFSTWGEYFNVQTKSLDMHIRYKTLASAFAVTKPGHMDGVQTVSFQFYDSNGSAAFKVFLTFGGKAPSLERMALFNSIRDRFALRG